MNRRQAAIGLAAGIGGFVMNEVSGKGDYPAGGAQLVDLIKRQEAKEKAFETLKAVGGFSQEDCEAARKAIVNHQAKEELGWYEKFVNHTYASMVFHHHDRIIRLPMFWQAVRVNFLMNIDGFKLLQVDDCEKEWFVRQGKLVAKIKELAKEFQKVDLPDISWAAR